MWFSAVTASLLSNTHAAFCVVIMEQVCGLCVCRHHGASLWFVCRHHGASLWFVCVVIMEQVCGLCAVIMDQVCGLCVVIMEQVCGLFLCAWRKTKILVTIITCSHVRCTASQFWGFVFSPLNTEKNVPINYCNYAPPTDIFFYL